MKKNKLLMVLVILSIFVSGCGNAITGGATCPSYECKLTTTSAKTESKILDDKGSGCLTDCSANIKIKNVALD